MMQRMSAEKLQDFTNKILLGMGARSEDATVVAEHLVQANLAGHDSHGVIRLPQYAQHAREGRLQPHQTVEIEQETTVTARVNGNWTWGQVSATKAIDLAIEKAKAHGLAAVTARQCYHVGRVGVYPLRAAEQGLIAKVWCNGHGVVRVAPWGGTEPRLATNPIAVAIPTDAKPILVDITTSVVAEGKVRLAKNQGNTVPDGWLLDRNGQPTNQPGDLYEGGSLLPFGGPVGHKGYALSLIVDLLGGLLSGAGCGAMAGVPVGNGLFIEVVDPQAFMRKQEYNQRMRQYINYLKSSKPLQGVAEILLPGEPEFRTEEKRRADGLELDDETWRQVCEVANSVNAPIPV
ncbi:MAG: Ldh family oxidoreductase [Planctomycetota bacterium]